MDSSYIKIDGSHGEGGGQILRSALTLSVILSKPIEIINIRKERKKCGLQPQHLTCVNACRDISGAYVDGNEIGSTTLRFYPTGIKSGGFNFDVAEKRGSAGSTSLVLQTPLLPLILGPGPCHLTILGGTHVPWSPPFHYLKEVFIPVIKRMGASVELSIDKWGWYPIGGGIIHAEITPLHPIVMQSANRRKTPSPKEGKNLPFSSGFIGELKGLKINERGRLLRISGISAVSNLPLSIAERQKSEGLKRLKDLGVDINIEVISAPSPGKGTFFFIIAEYENIKAGFSSLGAIGKKAEDVAQEACRDFHEYHMSHGAADPHLADQIIPFIALGKGTSSFTTTRVTKHLITNIWTVKQLMNIEIKVEGKEGESGRVVL